MTGPESVQVITEILNREKISYMVVGSFSSNYNGIPRSTKDADIVLEFDESSWSKLNFSI